MTPRPDALFHLVHDRPGALWLQHGDDVVLCWDPVEVVVDSPRWVETLRALRRPATGTQGPFGSGVAGFLGYSAARQVVPLAPAPSGEPESWLARYEGSATWSAADDRWRLSGPLPFQRQAQALLDQSRPPGEVPPAEPRAVHTIDKGLYLEAIARILAWLTEGDCYQVNLTRAVHAPGPHDAWAAFRRLLGHGLGARGGFLQLGHHQIVSDSPELLLGAAGDLVWSEPIKGTRPRGAGPEADLALIAELTADPKERAELTMIVDLVRNDLHRVAIPGTVVTSPRAVRSHLHVHHAFVDVRARLLAGLDVADALAALFPAGSVTGAPKIRAMERIAQLESEPRGLYCGSMGMWADSGEAQFNVAIRTAVVHERGARWHVGGGIVVDSDPLREWDETEHKGRALRDAFAPGPA